MASTSPSGFIGPKRVLIIYNPTAGRLRRGRFLKVLSALRCLDCDVTVQETTRRGDAEAFARLADPTEIDAVVAAGGDGTIDEVANGLLGRGLPLGIIPLGTANVLAAEIGLSLEPQAIATVIATGSRLRCHPGQANGRFFLMMAGVGFDAHVVKNVSSMLKKLVGKGAYVWTTLRQLCRHTPNQYKVTWRGASASAASVVVGKGHFYGGRYICTPDARLEKPTFQVCLFRDSGPWATLKYIIGLFRGNLPLMASVTFVETDQLRIDGHPGDPVQGGGDIIAYLPLDVRISEKTLDLLTPA